VIWAGLAVASGCAGLAVAGAALLRRRLVAVTVTGHSMLPAYRPGDQVLVRRGVVPRRDQVVVVELPNAERRNWNSEPAGLGSPGEPVTERQWLLKRVSAVAGDPLSSQDKASGRVPPDHLLLLGDNASVSFDSRQMGPFPMERVLGTVWRRL
jgi:signal peptidase I